MSDAAAGRQVFRPALGRRVVGALLGSIAFAVLAAVLVPRLFPVTTPRDVRAGLTLVVVLVGVGVIWAVTLWWSNLRVVVTAAAVEVHRPGMRLHAWARDETAFSSSLTKRYVNGIPAGTTRTLVARGPGGTVNVAVPLGREDFTRLMAVVTPLAPPAAPAEPDPAVVGPRVFLPDPAPIAARAMRLGIGAGVGLLVTFGVLVLLATGVWGRDDTELATVGVAVAAVVTVVLAVLTAIMLGRARQVPERIEVAPGMLTVDDRVFPLTAVRAVRLSPPAYPVRRLAITDAAGSTHRWLLGEAHSPRTPQLLPAYPELVAAVAAAGAGTEGVVLYDLR
ncbi:hypothetical protein [Microbacterium sp. SORGH_AS_0888]|uniref:hypothetical protein n=1 Tax=Microbacterium sp. SORGH_AS_0888 TaxID=3041791 RepID=UPI00278A6A1A|nr:hypothetical protein [Microbacterium sp. SORGH_AS_0888]MDQ1129878.1 hypothetical protein [Microbacterium sp. SORGH_AS_0888]